MVVGKGLERGYLSEPEIREIIQAGLESLELTGKRVLVLVPDLTRTMPVPFVFRLFEELLLPNVKKLDYLVALGTHQPLNDSQLSTLIGKLVCAGQVGISHIFNHEWNLSDTFRQVGTIGAGEIAHITEGLLSQDVPVRLNKLIFEYDEIIICGPVFPHEVVGFSGGNKYFFPGIAGPEIINITHWLGALLTCYKVIGTLINPVRIVIERAAELIPIPTAHIGFVVDHSGVSGVFIGPVKESWQATAQLSGVRNIVYKNKPFERVLSVMPEKYDDMWTAAKGMYKLEPIVADGGEVVIYAPHIQQVSCTHGKLINDIGYHCRDYFIAQWDKYKHFPGGVLAHSTHLRGLGTYDPLSKIESCRIKVTLATKIPREVCHHINLGFLDYSKIKLDDWMEKEDQGILVVPHAGEVLYRLK